MADTPEEHSQTSQAAGTRQCIDDGALTKRFQAGRIDIDALTSKLGEVWEGDAVSLKPYPCFRPSHPAIDAAIAIHHELRITSATSIANITLETDARCYQDQFEGGAHKRRPRHVIEAQFATPFLTATALLRGHVRINDVAGLGDTSIFALAERIEGKAVAGRIRGWARLTVTLNDGRVVTREVTNAGGSPESPMTNDALDAKFRDCAMNAVAPITPAAMDKTIAFVRNLWREDHACALVRAISGMRNTA